MRLESDIQDIFMPDPGVHDEVECGVCGTKMNVRRNLEGPTSYVMAVGGSRRRHDTFTCPHRDEVWHKQVIELRKFVKSCPSARLNEIVGGEIDLVLSTRQATK